MRKIGVKTLRILLAGGGTAGHINPALAIAGYAKEMDKDTEILFVGTKKGLESSLVPQAGYDIKYIKVEGLSKKLTFENFKSLIHMLSAKSKCKKIIRDFKPDIVIGTGGYVCAPAVMAANSMNIPTLIHEQNVFPGSAIKHLSAKSSVTAISFEESRKYLAGAKELLFTGNPIRPSILKCKRENAREKFNLGNEKMILIFGGSLGAEALNRVSLEYMSDIGEKVDTRILFATGQRNYEQCMAKAKELGIDKKEGISIVPYIHNMDEAMNAADVCVCRSGAITVSELCALSKPAILVPSPNVTNNHQEYNARALSDNGAAITILEKDFNKDSLKSALESILSDDEKAAEMQNNSKKISSVNALDIIYIRMKELTDTK